jgi:hypothetical protein
MFLPGCKHQSQQNSALSCVELRTIGRAIASTDTINGKKNT